MRNTLVPCILTNDKFQIPFSPIICDCTAENQFASPVHDVSTTRSRLERMWHSETLERERLTQDCRAKSTLTRVEAVSLYSYISVGCVISCEFIFGSCVHCFGWRFVFVDLSLNRFIEALVQAAYRFKKLSPARLQSHRLTRHHAVVVTPFACL